MSHSTYPAGSDVADRLTAPGTALTVEEFARLDGYASAAVAEWERLTDRRPFLAAGSDSTRRLDAPVTRNGVLLLDRPLATLTSIAYQPIGDGSTTLVSGDEYTFEPINAEADGQPIERIIFASQRWPGPLGYPFHGSIYITGRWGYTTSLTDEVWEAILARACLRAWPTLRQRETGGLASLQREGVTTSYAAASPLPGEWKATWDAAAAVYRNVSI